MRLRAITLTLGLLALLPCRSACAEEEVRLHVNVNRNQIYVGESVILTVRVSGMDKPEQPDLSRIMNCDVRLLSSHSDSRYSITIINGKMKRTGFSGRVFTYEVTPSITGVFVAGPVRLRVDGRTISADGPSIQIAGLERQDRVLIDIAASRQSVLVDEPFEITLSIAIKRMKGRYAEHDPLDPLDPPTLNVPYLDTAPIQGLDCPDISKLLQEHLISRRDAAGFAINNYTVRSDPFGSMFDFDDFMRKDKAKFRFDRREVEKDGQSYFRYVLRITYTPREEGSHVFGPVVFKGKAVMGVDAGGHLFGKPVFAVGPACTVRVVPPPEEGRPPTFIGAIGTNLTVEAFLDTQTCNVGDPLTLTVAVSGSVSMNNIHPPNLSSQSHLTRDFRIYDDTVQTITKEGRKEYVYTLRPTKAGTLELPPIEVSYYDVHEQAYKTARTIPIPVRANEAVEIAESIIIDTVTNRAVERDRAGKADALSLAPLSMDPRGAEPASIMPGKRHIIFASLGPLAYCLVLAICYMRTRVTHNAQAQKRRNALRRAISLLRDAEKTADSDPEKASLAICASLRKYLSDRFDATESGLTPFDARTLLLSRGIDPGSANRFYEILERNFDAAYMQEPGQGHNVSADCQAARDIAVEVDNDAKKRRRGHGKAK